MNRPFYHTLPLFAYISVVGMALNSCNQNEPYIGEKEISQDSEIQENDIIKRQIVGDWHFYSGNRLNGLCNDRKDTYYDKILTFNESHGYIEQYCSKKGNGRDFLYHKKHGIWNLIGDTIVISDIYEESGTYKYLAIFEDGNEDVLTIIDDRSHLNRTDRKNFASDYRRVGTEYQNIKDEILGYWYFYGSHSKSDWWCFNDDGFIKSTSYYWIDNSPIPGRSEYLWEITNNNELKITSYPVMSYKWTHKINFLNDTYFSYQTTILKNQDWVLDDN